MLGTLALAFCKVCATVIRGMDCKDGKLIKLCQVALSGAARKGKISSVRDPSSGIQMERIIYHCWKTSTRYDEAKYLLALEE